jgi:hypothetical protein
VVGKQARWPLILCVRMKYLPEPATLCALYRIEEREELRSDVNSTSSRHFDELQLLRAAHVVNTNSSVPRPRSKKPEVWRPGNACHSVRVALQHPDTGPTFSGGPQADG